MVKEVSSFGDDSLASAARGTVREGNGEDAVVTEKRIKELMRELKHTQKELAQFKQRYGDIGVNRKYKDSVFTSLFSERKYAFMLYQDLHPEDGSVTEEDIEIITVENIFTSDLYNDAAMKIGSRLIVLSEHQSTYSFNMLTRMLLYIAEEYKRLLDGSMDLLYQKDGVMIPAPEFYMVYTGEWKEAYKAELLLSDLLVQQTGALELKVSVIYDPAEESILGEYTSMIKEIESLIADGMQKMTAIETVVSEYRNSRYRISDFLIKRKDVLLMFNRDITLEEIIEVRGREERQKGRMEGKMEGRIMAYHEFGLSVKEIAMRLSISEQHVQSVLENEMLNV